MSGGVGTLASAVADRLRADIIAGVFAPGLKLKIDTVCRTYSAGASPVREALNRLAAEGLVVANDQRGFAVAPISLDDLRDLVATRCDLEALALTRAMSAKSPAWEETLVLAFHRLSRTPRSVDAAHYRANPVWEAQHIAFHEALIAGCGSPHLLRLCADLRARADRYRQLAAAKAYPRRQEGDEHRAILDAALDGDTTKAVALLVGHYAKTLAIIEETRELALV